MANLNQLSRKQLKDQIIDNAKVANDAAIAESKLNIAWSTHYHNALEVRKIVDYVQMNGVAVSGTSFNNFASKVENFDVTPNVADGVLGGADSALEGIIVENNQLLNKNKIIIRKSSTGEPLYDASNNEVYGRMTFANSKFVMSFYSGADVAISVTDTLDVQYQRRINLDDISELFANNERFVDGAVDITEIQNLKQLAKDLYGTSWTLDNDGATNLSESIKAGIDRIDGANTVTGSINKKIKDQVLDPLASTVDASSGGDMVKITTISNVTGTSVQAALEDIAGRLYSQENGGGAEVTDTHTREADSANDFFLASESYTSLEGRLIAIETVVDERGKALDVEEKRADDAEKLIVSNLASTATDLGASLIGIKDATGQITATTVEGALAEIVDASQQLVLDMASTSNAKGAGLIGIEDVASQITATTVEGALTEIVDTMQQHVLDTASTSNAKGASLVGIEDAAGQITATTVEGALAEIVDAAQQLVLDTASTSNGKGASLMGIEDVAGQITATTVEGALTEIVDTMQQHVLDTASTATAKGASLIGIEDAANQITATTVEGALAEIVDAAQLLVSDLASTATGKGASLIGIKDAGGVFTATTVEGVLAEIEGRVNTLEDNGGAEVTATHVRESNTGFFAADTVTDLEGRLVQIEGQIAGQAGAGLVYSGNAGSKVLDVNVDSSTLTIAADVVKVKAGGITVTELGTDAVETLKIKNGAVTADKLESTLKAKIHNHVEEMSTGFTGLEYTTTTDVSAWNDFVAVYVNGVRQLPGTHYNKSSDLTATKAVITFEEALTTGDNLYIEIVKYI